MKRISIAMIGLGGAVAAYGIFGFEAHFGSYGFAEWSRENQLEIAIGVALFLWGIFLRKGDYPR